MSAAPATASSGMRTHAAASTARQRGSTRPVGKRTTNGTSASDEPYSTQPPMQSHNARPAGAGRSANSGACILPATTDPVA